MFSRSVIEPEPAAAKKPTVPAIVNEVLRSPGRPLDGATRSFMEPRFGHDFSRVRVHSEGAAGPSAQKVNAHAYTVGHDIVLGGGHPALEMQAGRRLLVHELTHVVQQSRSGGVPVNSPSDIGRSQSKISFGAAGDSYEQEACRVSGEMMRWPKGPLPRISASPHSLQRDRGFGGPETRIQEAREEAAKRDYLEFVKNAMTHGLPVKFLADVARTTLINPSSANAYNATLGILNLKPKAIAEGREWAPTHRQKVSPTDAIRAIYHESTHAYLHKHQDEEPIKQFYERGTQHYEGAPTNQRGITTSDPEQVFQEACAGYVSTRVVTWWMAFSQLTHALEPPPPTLSILDDIRTRYDAAMNERIFGYSPEGGFFSKEQVSTTRPLSAQMKTFLDHHLLEDKIPDKFDQVAAFKDLFAKAKAIAKGT